MAQLDDYRQQLQDAAKKKNVQYDESDLQGLAHRDFNQQALDSTLQRYDERAAGDAKPGQGAGAGGGHGVSGDPGATGYQGYQPDIGSYQKYQYNWSKLPGQQTPYQVTQYQQAPGQQDTLHTMQSQLSQMLANPHTMNDQAVAQLKEKQKETALQMQKDQMGQLQQSAAGRGMGYVNPALQAQVGQGTQQNILGQYRDIDLNALQQNRQDELNVMNAGNAFTQNVGNLGAQSYQQQLAGQMAQANQDQQAFNSNVQLSGLQDDRERTMAGENNVGYQNELARQGMLFNSGMGSARFGLDQLNSNRDFQLQSMAQQIQQNQFAQQLAMNQSQFGQNFGENQRQFNGSQANQLQMFNQGQNSDFTRWLMGQQT